MLYERTRSYGLELFLLFSLTSVLDLGKSYIELGNRFVSDCAVNVSGKIGVETKVSEPIHGFFLC